MLFRPSWRPAHHDFANCALCAAGGPVVTSWLRAKRRPTCRRRHLAYCACQRRCCPSGRGFPRCKRSFQKNPKKNFALRKMKAPGETDVLGSGWPINLDVRYADRRNKPAELRQRGTAEAGKEGRIDLLRLFPPCRLECLHPVNYPSFAIDSDCQQICPRCMIGEPLHEEGKIGYQGSLGG